MRLFLLLFVVVGLAACAPRPVLPPLDEPTAELSARLHERLAENSAAFQSLEGFGRIRIVHPERRMGANQVLFVEKPDRFRSETLSPFGQPVLFAATDGDQFSVYIPSVKAFYSGAASLENVQRFIPIPLQVADLVHIILYDPPLLPYVHSYLRLVPDQGYLLVLDAGTGARQELLFDGLLRLRESSYFHKNELQLLIRYDKFSEENAGAFPMQVEMRMPPLAAQATVELRDIELNPGIPVERFSLTPPTDVPILPIP
jgi:outer membrane lipoprotein-sorting protein